MGFIAQYQDIIASVVGVGLGVVASVIGWQINRLYKRGDEIDQRMSHLEHEAITIEELRRLENKIDESIARTCANMRGIEDRLSSRFDALMQHLVEVRGNGR